MGENWLQERIKYLESFLVDKSDYPIKMKERDKNLIKVLKKFNSLPEKQQNKLKPMVEKTLERHNNVTRCRKIFDYYSSNFDLSLNLKPN